MSDVVDILDAFFGDGNELDPAHPSVAEWIDTVRRGWPLFPLVLPRVTAGRADGTVRWYIITTSTRQARRVRDEFTAWIGPTYSSSWTGQAIELDQSDPIEQSLAGLSIGPVVAFEVADGDREDVRRNLRQLHDLWMGRPDRVDEVQRRVGLLLRDFELALASGTPETAAGVLRELEARGLLTAENAMFLRYVLLDARSEWRELASHPRLGDVAAGPRPWAVTRAVVTALYRTELVGAETADDVAPFIQTAIELDDRYPNLFHTRGAIDRPELAKAFALIDAGRPDRPRRTRMRVLDAPGLTPADRSFLEDLLGLGTESPSAAHPVEHAREMFERGEFDVAWDAALSAPESEQRAVLLIQCAAEIGTLRVAQLALAAFSAMTSERRDALTNASRRFERDLSDVVSIARPVAPQPEAEADTSPWTWVGWLEALHGRERWPEAVDIARRIADEAVAEPDVDGLVEMIAHEREPSQQRVFVAALASLLTWLDRLADASAAQVVRTAVLEAICLQDLRGVAALDAALHVVERLLTAGLTPDEYRSVLEHLEILWSVNVSAESVGWLTEALELLADHPADREALTASAGNLIHALGRYRTRITRSTAEDLVGAAEAAGASDAIGDLLDVAAPPRLDDETRLRLHDKVVGCYTLTPGVGDRVKRALESLIPGLTVVVNSDHVRTDALDHIARTADVMVVMLRSAKHAATDAIDRARPKDAVTLRLGCRGSTRVVEEFLNVAPNVG